MQIVVLVLTVGTVQMQAERVLYVAQGGSGTSCTQAQPCASIATALSIARRDVTISIGRGVYREFVSLQNTSHVTLEGDGAVISGLTLVTGWRSEGDGLMSAPSPALSISSNPWPNDVNLTWAGAVSTHVWLDGARLRPTQGVPSAGQFKIAENRLLVRNERQSAAEVASIGTVINIVSSSHVTLRGLTVDGCASAIAGGCVIVRGSSDVLIADVTVRRGAYSGVHVYNSQRVTVRGLTAEDNGARGLGVNESGLISASGLRFARNGWRFDLAEAWGSNRPQPLKPLVAWDGGNKLVRCTQCALSDVHISAQVGPGVWWDFANVDALLEDFVIDGATLAGVFVEANTQRVTLRRGLIRGVSRGDVDYWGGLFVTGSDALLVEDLRIVGGTQPNAVLFTNPVRNVDGVNTTMRGGVLRNVVIERSSGQAINFANDTTGYAQTTLIEARYTGGGFRLNGRALSAQQFNSALAAGSSISQGVPVPTSTPTATATATASATATTTATATETPITTPAWRPVWRIRIEIVIERSDDD